MVFVLAVLLAQVVAPPSDEAPVVPSPDIAGSHRRWEALNSACRRLPDGSVEGRTACYGRDAVGLELGRLGWCLRQLGLEIQWEMCPRR
jgi:hypothetical protein